MKRAFIIIVWVATQSACFSQPSQQQEKIDSVCVLVRQYFNVKDVDKLYALAGEAFKKQSPPAMFKQVCDNNLFPFGELKQTVFEQNTNGVSKYKAVFATVNLNLFLSLDKDDKIEEWLFQPYTDDKAKKATKPPFTNPLATVL